MDPYGSPSERGSIDGNLRSWQYRDCGIAQDRAQHHGTHQHSNSIDMHSYAAFKVASKWCSRK